MASSSSMSVLGRRARSHYHATRKPPSVGLHGGASRQLPFLRRAGAAVEAAHDALQYRCGWESSQRPEHGGENTMPQSDPGRWLAGALTAILLIMPAASAREAPAPPSSRAVSPMADWKVYRSSGGSSRR